MFKTKPKIFLDYCQLYIESLVPTTDIFTILLKHNGLGLTIVSDSLLENKERGIRVFFIKDAIKVHLSGKYFKSDNLADNISEIIQAYKCLTAHKVFKPALISRLDIAENDYGKTLKNYYITNINNSEVTEITNNGTLNTIYLGKRGAKSVIYRCYDKRNDKKGKFHSIVRFQTNDYCRHEYELPRDVLTRYGIHDIGDLKNSKIEDLYKWISYRKRVSFVNPAFLPQDKPKKIYISKSCGADLKKLHKMIKGIYTNNFDKDQGIDSIKKIRSEVYGV